MSTSRALVLGGNGFLGSHLVDALAAGGYQVDVLGRDPTLFNPGLVSQHAPRLRYHQGSFSDVELMRTLLTGADVIFHLVSSTIPASSNLNPVADIEDNLIATVRMLDLLREMPPKRVIYISSGGTVYGTPEYIPIPETHRLDPKNSYGIVKVAAEKYLHMYHELYGMNSLVLRLANPFGPRQMKIGVQGVIATVLMSVLHDKPITIWGDGGVVRDYVYIEDVTRLLLLVMDSPLLGTFNVGSGMGHSLQDILSIAEKITGKPPQVNYLPSRSFDIPEVVLDIGRIRYKVGWQPEVSLVEGMTRHWHWLQQHTDGI